MAGSLQSFLYETDIPGPDPGQRMTIVLRLDESNAILMGGQRATTANINALIASNLLLNALQAKGIKPRTMAFEGATAGGKVVRRQLVAPDPDNLIWRNGGTLDLPVLTGGANGTVEMVEFRAVYAKGERRQLVRYADVDTGLDDGTQP